MLLGMALATGLCLGGLDALVDLEARTSLSSSPLTTWVCLGCSSLLGAAAFVVAWIVATPLRWRWRIDRGALSLGLAAAVQTLAVPVLLACFRGAESDIQSSLVALPAALLVACGVVLLARPFSSRPHGALNVELFAAWVSFAVLAACTLRSLHKSGGASTGGLLGAGLATLLALAASALWMQRRAQSASAVRGLLGLLFMGALAAGLLHLRPDDSAAEDRGRVPAGRKPRQIVLVVVDTLRADHLSCYSKQAQPTPNFDALAADSVFFEHPRASAPWTFPSMASLLSGLAPTVHLGLRTNDALPDRVRTLASRMQEAGFLTAAFVRNPTLREYTHIDRGFDEYHYQREPHLPTALAEFVLRAWLPEIYLPQVGAQVQTRRAAEWIAAHRDRDFFLWVHYLDPHMAYNPPRQFQPEGTPPARIGRNFEDTAGVRGGFLSPDAQEREWIRKLYAGEVLATDLETKALFDELRQQGLYDDALIVFTADHGDELWEHEGFEHGHSMYDEVLAVPLMLKLPGGVLGHRVDVPVSNQSVTPTILEVAGVPYDPAEMSAPALVRRDPASQALILDAAARPLVSSGILYFEPRTAIVFEGFKYIQFHVSAREELYDLSSDPAEAHNLIRERPETAAKGRALLKQHVEAAASLRRRLGIDTAQTHELDSDALRDMRALGYVK